MAFATLALSELVLVFGMRSVTAQAWRLPRNPWLLWSVAASAAVVAATVYLPATHEALATVALGPREALAAAALALVPFALVEAAKTVRRPGRARSLPRGGTLTACSSSRRASAG